MQSIFENKAVDFEVVGKYHLHIDKEGVSYEPENGKKPVDIRFKEAGSILSMRYCSSNEHYDLIFRDLHGRNMAEIETDINHRPAEETINGHNVLETKSILIAFAEYKLGKAFPENLDQLDLPVAFSLKEKEIRLSEGILKGSKHNVKLSDIRRVKIAGNGTLNNLLIYTKDKGGLFDMPDMTVPVNELTLPILDASVIRNTGKSIDASLGNGFDQKDSKYIIERYMNSTFFLQEDGSTPDDWRRLAHMHVFLIGADIGAMEPGVYAAEG